jgi:predicted small lipoprotein YifL
MNFSVTRLGKAFPRLLALALLGSLAACGTVGDDAAPGTSTSAPLPLTERPTTMRNEQLLGKWGIASYRQDKDRSRVEAQARAQCKLPYEIAKGPSDGVMMHVADDAKPYELRLKGASNGKTYLGLEAPPGDWQDREIVSLTGNMIVMRFVDPEVHSRYGTFIYVRCSG